MGKRVSTLMAVLCAAALCMGLAACGNSEPAAGDSGSTQAVESSSGQAATAPASGGVATMPSSNVDPADIEAGIIWDNSGDNGTSDIWYKDGVEGSEGIYFTNAANDAGISVSWLDANGKETDSQFNLEIADKHLVSQEGAEPTVDIVFNDNMTCYDYTTSTWYIRGDQEVLDAAVAGKTFVEEGHSLTFNADGTVAETLKGEDYEGTWEVTSPTVVEYWPSDASRPVTLRIVQDDAGVTLYDGSYELKAQ